MNISSVSSSSQMQELLALLAPSAKSSASSSDSALSSLLGSQSDSLSISPDGQRMSKSQGSDPFKADLENLGKLIDSGDLAGAKKAFATMKEKMDVHKGDKPENNPMASEFAALGKALDSDDTTSAKAAWSSIQSAYLQLP